jgi:hypothetical protein
MDAFTKRQQEQEQLRAQLFENLKSRLPELEELLSGYQKRFGYEDAVYRFYHQSFKVYHLQEGTLQIVAALRSLLPDRQINKYFQKILEDGTGKEFHPDDNLRWLDVTRPIVEAFGHALYFLAMAVKYGRELEALPDTLPSGWAAFLYLFDLR